MNDDETDEITKIKPETANRLNNPYDFCIVSYSFEPNT